MAWDEEGVCCFGSNAEKLVPTVKSGGTGEAGTGGAADGERGKLNTTDWMDSGLIRVGSISCSAFGGLSACDGFTM